MAISYAQTQQNTNNQRNKLNDLLSRNHDLSEEITCRGRYIGALQAQIKAAKRNGYSTSVPILEAELRVQLRNHQAILKTANKQNKKGNYSMIKEFSLGFKRLVTSAKQISHAETKAEKKEARKNMASSVGASLKNVVKAPIVITTKILSTSLVATVLFAPISLGMGILHAAWTAIDDKPSPYDNHGVEKMSHGFKNVMVKLSKATSRI